MRGYGRKENVYIAGRGAGGHKSCLFSVLCALMISAAESRSCPFRDGWDGRRTISHISMLAILLVTMWTVLLEGDMLAINRT